MVLNNHVIKTKLNVHKAYGGELVGGRFRGYFRIVAKSNF